MKKHPWKDEYEAEMSDLVGKTFSEVVATEDSLSMKCQEGVFTFFHSQDCCESVYIESIVGDLSDLIGAPILIAEEVVSASNPEDAKPETIEYQDSFTWTFYKFATRKGYVDVRWYGESNGYYSESVEIRFDPADGCQPEKDKDTP